MASFVIFIVSIKFMNSSTFKTFVAIEDNVIVSIIDFLTVVALLFLFSHMS